MEGTNVNNHQQMPRRPNSPEEEQKGPAQQD